MNERIVEILRTGNDQKDLPRIVSSLPELDDPHPLPWRANSDHESSGKRP
jgi:hypothetical protein